jgi:hypothetical protein
MRAEHAHRLARLDQQGLVVLQPLQRLHDRIEARPVARRPPDAAIDDEAFRRFGHVRIEVVLQHPHRRLGRPGFGPDLAAGPRPDLAAIVAS